MKSLATFFLLAVSASIPYFGYVRPLGNTVADRQAYASVDETIWAHARSDLGDLRLFDGTTEVPYALSIEYGGTAVDQKEVRLLQPGDFKSTGQPQAQFLLDMFGLAEYDRVELRIGAHDFVSQARVEGANDARASAWALLRTSAIYDLTSENLGSNTTVRLPVSTYRFLRITLSAPLRAADVAGATAASRAEEKAVWKNIAATMQQEQRPRETVFTFSPPKSVPIDRIQLTIDGSNFRREAEIRGDDNQWLAAIELSRVHLVRRGQKLDSEQTAVDLHGVTGRSLRLIIQNGDDHPLKIASAQLQQYERRLYFNAPAGAVQLYYGDEKLSSPVYDYAKLFVKDATAVAAQLGAEQRNPQFQARLDDRPWSERHPAVLWIAIIAAVILLGAVALRSMKAPPPSGQAAAQS